VQDKNRAQEFATGARERRTVTVETSHPNRAILTVGSNEWPLPIPIVRHGKTWSFDASAGREEILNRRIGGNELDAIETCRGYVEAQHEYALTKHDPAAVNQYAQRVSTPGKQDGLAWQTPTGRGPVHRRSCCTRDRAGYSAVSPYAATTSRC
jgi:hypothetical protein